ncbi:ribonuclease R [Saccharobesus litoralis]|uniref:Ribonuclease R n=1 Tax=Saccharobesus litoralis TaxID=2172099 RepID=A0A2S0VRY6_9ALTE|nr:ribonuclease R [Saccharobesus litoralis]AWB66978.1 ribonuclease R [Saccharobesus litoralis]
MAKPANTPQYHPLLAEKVAAFVEQSLAPVSFEQLCHQHNTLDNHAQREMHACLEALDAEGRVILAKKDQYSTPEKLGLVTGKVIGHREGFGFLNSGAGKDLFIAGHMMTAYIHGDFVLAKLGGSDKKGRREARLIRVLQSRQEAIVGRYFVEHGLGFVVPDDSRIQHEVIIEPGNNKNARHGQMVVVDLIKRPSKRTSAIGKVSEVLGDHMAPGMEIDVALRNYDIPHSWSRKVLKELDKIADEVPEQAKLERQDLRQLPLVTIDGEDARDFDDAVYCERKRSGGWRLWVAIADVSYYVRPGTELDNQAQERGTSVYFPEQVVPMLPEKLSNGLCSLNPNVDRLCMVCEMTISEAGNLSGYQFYPAVMNSHARLTYTKVGKILDGDEKLREQYQAQVPHLENLHQMYLRLKERRMERGAIEFETPEPKFIFNADRKIDSIELVVRNDAHKLIEESMILANVAAAKFIEKHKAQALFRVHEPPEGERLTKFIGFLGELGITVTLDNQDISPHTYKALVERIQGRPDQELIQTMMLRSMQQAIYSGDNQGHFGLALKGYSHFTSPIRRYPDLVLHRAIKSVLVQQKAAKRQGGEFQYQAEDIDQLAEHTSMTERRADEATRDVANWLKCEFMRDHIGCTYGGVISAVTSFGFFVRVHDLYIEGLVHIGSLGNDYYIFDNAKQRLVGERTRQVYKLGDEVVIQVTSVNLEEKKIDFIIAPPDAKLDEIDDRRASASTKQPSKSEQLRKESSGQERAGSRSDKKNSAKKSRRSGKGKSKAKTKGSRTQQLMQQEKSKGKAGKKPAAKKKAGAASSGASKTKRKSKKR